MIQWIALHQPELLGLAGILAAILLINWVLRTGPTRVRAPYWETSTPADGPLRSGSQDRSVIQPARLPAPQNRAARRRRVAER